MIKIETLKNGMVLILDKIDYVKSLTIGVYIKTGSKYELVGEEGISHLLEHMSFKGTEKRSSAEISEDIDNVGGRINAFTSKELTSYYITTLGSQYEVAIDVLADMYINSTFQEKELEKEKKVVIEEIRMYEDIPEEKIHDINSELSLKGGGTANSVLGTEESVSQITREQLISYWNERYTTDNMVIAVAGNFEEEKIIKEVLEKFASLERKKKERDYNKKFCLNKGENIIKKDTNQVHLCVNVKGISFYNEDKYILSIMSNILGGNMSSRLFRIIREERGLAYSTYTYASSYEEGGMFTAYAGTTKENYKEVIELIKKELENIKKDGITEKELQKAKNQLTSSLTIGLETTKARMSRLASSYITYNKIKNIDEIMEKISKVSLEDVKRLANELFDEDYYSTTILGNV